MTVVVVVGVIADKIGAAAQWETINANHPGRNFDVRRVFSSVPSTEYSCDVAPATRVSPFELLAEACRRTASPTTDPNGRRAAVR